MAENKNAIVNETANENGNAAITERLDNVAERVAEAAKATQAVAEEHSLRRDEQEQHAQRLQKEEEERRAQAAEAAKSVANRRAAVLDYTENYRQNQKIAKAARATVSKAKLERLAAEAEAKARAEREAEEALHREREELMARRNRSASLLNKMDNESEAEAPEAKTPVAAPAEEAMPKEEVSAFEAEVPVSQEAEPDAEDASVQDDTPDVLDINIDASADADDAASASDEGLFEDESDEDDDIVFVEDRSEEIDAAIEKVDNDLKIAEAEAQEQMEREAEAAKTVDNDLAKIRVAGIMPAHMIPDSLRLHTASKAPILPSVNGSTGIESAMQRLEDALVAAALRRIDNMARRIDQSTGGSDGAATAAVAGAAAGAALAVRSMPKTQAGLADAAVNAGLVSGDVLPAAYDARAFDKRELRHYKKSTKREISEKRKALKETKKNPGESTEDFEYRRLERQAALLGTEFGAIALLSSKGHLSEAEAFKKNAEKDVRAYNKSIAKYNRSAMQPLTPLPQNVVERIASERKLPENLPFGSAATGLDATLSGGVNEEASKNAAQTEQDALRKEMQKQMLLHAMVWNPAVASAVQGMVASIYAEENGNAAAASMTASAKSFDQLSAEQKRLLSEYEQALGADAAFLKNDLQRLEYYENRLAMIDVKRNELDEFYANTKHLPQQTRRTVCAERRLGLIKEELALLGLLNRYPNDRIAERCRQGCEVDIAEYNRLIAGIPPKERATEPLSMMLPAHVLARGVDASTASLMLPADSMPTGDEDPFAPHRLALLAGFIGSDTQSETVRKAQEIRENEILQAAARQNREYDAAIERITSDYERTIREYNAAAKEADLLAAENADDPAAAEAKERAEELGARADEEAQKLVLLRTAKEATDRSEEMSEQRKEEMLALAAVVASDEKDAKAAKKLKKYAAAESRKADKAVERAEEQDWKNVAIWEQSLASAEARARAAEESAQDAGENAERLLAEKACNSELHAAYGEALLENSKAGSARRSADVIQGKREAEKESIAKKREARDAMIAFAAAMEIEEAMPAERPLPKRESRKLDAAIQKANERYESAHLAAANAEEAFLRMTEDKEDSAALRAAQRYTAVLREEAAHAEEKLTALNVAKSAAEKSRIMSEEERAELLSLAIAAAEADDERAAERLQRQVALAVKKEDRAEKRAMLKAERDLKRQEGRLADAEARAQLSEQAALNARSRVEALSAQKADKNALRHAYEQMLLEEKRAEDARSYAKTARAKHEAARERAESHKEAKTAMLAFAGALSVADKKGEPEKKSAPSRAMRKLDAAIDEANASYERALKAEGVAKTSRERTAEQQTFVSAAQTTEKVKTDAKKDRKRVTKAKKEELHKSYVAAIAEDRKTEKAGARTTEQRKKIIAEAETVAQRSEERAEVAKARVKELSAKKASKKELQAAYEQAMRAEAEAERARKYAENVKSSPTKEKKNKSESHKEAKTAMLAFAAAFAASEKKAKEQNARMDTPGDELKALDAAIAEANKNLEKAKAAQAAFADLKADEVSKTSRKGMGIEKAELKKNAELAENRVDTLRTAKNAVERSRTLSREEKADMIALVMAFNDDAASESTAKELSKKIAIAEKREAAAIRKAAKTSDNGIVSTKRMAEAEAKAQLSEREAIAAKERVKILAEKNVDKKALEEAYRQALQAESKATRARKTAEKVKEEEISKKESVASHKEARKAMLTFATAFAVANNDKAAKQARKENEGKNLVTKQERALDAAILSANKRFERAEDATLRTSEKEARTDTRKEERSALVAFAAAFAALGKKKSKAAETEKRGEALATKQEHALDAAIASANKRFERAEAEKRAAQERVSKLSDKKASKSERKAARKALVNADDKVKQASTAVETLESAKEATKKSKVLSSEEKADMLALVMATNADARDAKSAEKLKKKIDAAAKKEEKAESLYLKAETARAEDRLDTLRAAKTAMNRSHTLSSEEKAEMVALVMAANADERDAATAAKLRKKIAAAEKREALAARKASKSTRRISDWEKRVAETEAAAQLAEKDVDVAKERVKTLSEKKAEKQTLYAAYEQAMRAEAKAEQTRKSADEVKKQYVAKQQRDESHKEAKAALVAFAAAFALSEKNKKAKKVREGTASVSRQERKLDAAILSANKRFERAEADKSAAQERLSKLSEKTAARSERKAARKEYIYAVAESERASAKLETLRTAKEATKKSKALSREEKAEMLSLVAAADADARDAKTSERLKKKVSDAVAKETAAEKKAAKQALEKRTALENKHLDREAAKRASEEAAWEAKQRADRLQKENADTKELHKAYKQALVEEARAEKARRAAEQSRAMRDASEKNTESHKEAKAAMLAFAAAVAAEEKVKKETGAVAPVYGRAASSVDALISDAERQYEKALAAKLASKEKVRELAATKATRRERAVAFEEAVRDEVALRKASERVQSLKTAKQATEKSQSLSSEQKAEMLALVMAADADRRSAKTAEKIQKKADAVAKKTQAADRIAEENLRKASDAWEKAIASAEAQALVSEEAALNAKRKARSIRDENPDRRALHKAYREALLEEARAERARKLADTARVERATAEKRPDDRRAAETAMIAFAADMAAEREVASFARHAEKAQAAEQQRLARRAAANEIGIAEAEAYARACEEKAALSEKKALLLAAEGGSKREKLKAYEAALLDKAAADKAKAKLAELQKQSNSKESSVLASDLAQMKADLALEDQRIEIEKANDVNEKIRLAMMEKIRRADERGLRKQKEQSNDTEQSDESDALIKTYTREEIAEQEKRDIAALKKERIRLMMEEKIRRADKKGHRATAASAAREAVLADKRQRADEKAWNLLVKRDEDLDRRRSYEEALRLAKQDSERTVLQKDVPFTAFSSMPAAALSKRAMAKRIKEFNERDIETLTARYDSEMAEAKRSLEVGLCDLSCTAAMARRLKAQTAANLRKLRRKKRVALRLEREDNKRYFACVRDVLQPKDAHDAAILAEHRERIFRLLEHRDYENTHLTSLYLADTFNGVTQKSTPWHKAFLREKKRWHRKLRKHVRKVGEMNLSRHDKQKLRVEIDRVATANADIAEARCRARKLKVRGLAMTQYRQEMIEMNREVRRTRRNLRRKMKAARAKEDYRNFWKVSILSLILTAALVVGGMYLWQQYGDQILAYLNANFPNIMSQLK